MAASYKTPLLKKFSPPFEELVLSKKETYLIEPFFTNLNRSVFAVSMMPPEVIGALCSRASRAKDDLRTIFLREFVKPFIEEKSQYGSALKSFITFLHKHTPEHIFANPKARDFFVKWLAQYGDDSIAQMGGTHIVYSGLSQVAIKHIEDMRIGLAPIEKSTRYVDYSTKVGKSYRYYTDPVLKSMGFETEYRRVMDNLFETYAYLIGVYLEKLKKQFPDEAEGVLKAKAFDVMRGLLPSSTLSQVAFFGNGQAFEYLLARSLDSALGEVRWAAGETLSELQKIIPAFVRRAEGDMASEYRNFLSKKGERLQKALSKTSFKKEKNKASLPSTCIIEYDLQGEDKIIAGLVYPQLHESFEDVLQKVKKLSRKDKENILASVLSTRKARWYKMPRAFEMAEVVFENIVNIGAWRDLHRHRLQTQIREKFHIYNGFDIPPEVKEAGLEKRFSDAIKKVEEVFVKIEKKDPEIAQYATVLAHRYRFLQKQNMRSFFWEAELRTIAQGHPDYRKLEQEKVKLIQKVYPLISKYLMVDMNDYLFARRGTPEKIKEKEARLLKQLQQS